jgi:hypothetical protein
MIYVMAKYIFSTIMPLKFDCLSLSATVPFRDGYILSDYSNSFPVLLISVYALNCKNETTSVSAKVSLRIALYI